MLSASGSPMSACDHQQYFNAQIDELKKLDNGIHHHKSFVFGYSSCHNFLFWDQPPKGFHFCFVYKGIVQGQFQPVSCQSNGTKSFPQFSSMGIRILLIIGHNGIGSNAYTTSRGHSKPCRCNTGSSHIAHGSFMVKFLIGLFDHFYNVIGH